MMHQPASAKVQSGVTTLKSGEYHQSTAYATPQCRPPRVVTCSISFVEIRLNKLRRASRHGPYLERATLEEAQSTMSTRDSASCQGVCTQMAYTDEMRSASLVHLSCANSSASKFNADLVFGNEVQASL